MADTKQTIHLFYGEDTYSSFQKLKFWREEFEKKYGENAVELLDGDKLNEAEFTTNIGSPPFLSEKRLIIVKDYFSNSKPEEQKKIANSLDKTIEECIIVFYENEVPDKRSSLFKKISKIGKTEEFPAMNPREMEKWVMEKAKKENIKINFATAAYLSEHCGPDLWTISNELEKLRIFADNKEITQKMIEEICIPSLTSSIFKLTDSISQKNIKESLKTFKILRESGEDLGMIFFMIVRHFRILIQVHEMRSHGEQQFSIIKKLKQHPFVIQKTSEQSQNFTSKKLEKIYQNFLEIDNKSKTGIIKTYQTDKREFELAIEKLIIECCK